MKILFSLFISLSFILFSFAQTITDGSATLTMTQDYISGTGCGSNAYFDAGNGIDQLFGMDWYIGIGDLNSENFPISYYYTAEGNSITAQYDDLLYTSGLSAELTITLTEMAPLDVQITQSMKITNNTGAPLDIRLFNYVDLDKNNTQSDNAVLLLEDDCNFTTHISDADDPSQTCYYAMNASDGYEIASFPDLCNRLLGGVDNLSNTGLPLSASDHTQALQYNATIPSGGVSTAEALITFGNPPEAATMDASGQCTFGGDTSGGGDCVTPDAATIQFADGSSTSTSICVDGIPDPLDVVTDGGTGTSSGWIITDDSNNILALPPAPPFDLDGAGVGTCLIWYVTYDDIGGNVVGNNASDLTGCFALSNSIEVVREICDTPPFDCTSNPVVINHNVDCQGNGTYNVQFSISGGGAGSQGGIYNVAGDFTGTVVAGEVRNISLAEGTIYNITVIDDGFGCSASISKGPNNCSKLPVELLDFNGETISEGNLLKWITASEIENDYFSLYSSVNGENYKLIHQQEGGGTISTAQQYQFLDRNALSGITYYQLQQTDFDGTTTNVGYTSVTRGEQLDFVLSDSFPNPFSNELNLNIYSNSNYNVIIRLITMLGNNVIQLHLNLQSGNNPIQLETDHLPAGLYMLNVQSNKHKQVYKLLKD